MSKGKYTTNQKLTKTYIGKYLLEISDIINNMDINSEEDVEHIIIDLETLHKDIYEKYNMVSKNPISKLGLKILEKRILDLENAINEIRIHDFYFRNDEEDVEDDDNYEMLIDDLRDDVFESLGCLV